LPFLNRADAGRRLGERLQYLRGEPVVVLGLPRGGVPVAFEVARALDAPLDIIVVRKLGVPYQPELGMGAIGERGVRLINDEVVAAAGVSGAELAAVETFERAELNDRARRFRGDLEPVSLDGRTAVVVDDGIATGSTARVACQVARALGAARVVLAVPVAPPDWVDRIGGDADELVCLEMPEFFFAIGRFYADFSQTTDAEVLACLRGDPRRRRVTAGDFAPDDPPVADEDVEVAVGSMQIRGHLLVPEEAAGVVVFAHGSGSSRHSPRNRFVADVLNQGRLGTLLIDLLTEDEEVERANVFDIGLLGQRLVDVSRWLRTRRELEGLDLGYFGASTGAAAALFAAAELGNDVAAVVSRGGRPDLAGELLARVTAPTLLIVGGHDRVVLALNEEAESQLGCESRLEVIPGATHLFEEPGALDAVAVLARDWFTSHLGTASSRRAGG